LGLALAFKYWTFCTSQLQDSLS